jgi:hypothetical protein
LDTPPAGVQRFVGVVVSSSYQGPTVSYRIKVAGGIEFKILLLNPSGPLYASGETLNLWVAREDLVLLSS